LFAKVKDFELLEHSMHEKGTLFYMEDEKGVVNKVAYFSNSRIVIYEGQVSENFAKIARSIGYKVRVLEYDDVSKRLKVEQ
jgi:hypothetical protein